MKRRYNLGNLILANVVVLLLTPVMVAVDAQARIAFVSDRDGNYDIYVMDVDGGNLRRLTNHPDIDSLPSWSPDGKRIVFTSKRDGHVDAIHGFATSEIYVMDADGDNPQNLTNHPKEDWYPSWSPDGKRIAFSSERDGNIEIYVMDADGGNPQNLTNNPLNDRDPSWSPDGKRIVFSARRDGHFENELALTYEIYVMDNDGGNQQRLTENRKNDWHPSWSPTGKRIAFTSDRKGDFQNFEIYVMDNDGGNQQRLTENRVSDSFPSWSPDGEQIVFCSDRDGHVHAKHGWSTNEIYVVDADGGNQQNLTNHPHDDLEPSWFSPPFSVSPTGKKITMWGWVKQIDR